MFTGHEHWYKFRHLCSCTVCTVFKQGGKPLQKLTRVAVMSYPSIYAHNFLHTKHFRHFSRYTWVSHYQTWTWSQQPSPSMRWACTFDICLEKMSRGLLWYSVGFSGLGFFQPHAFIHSLRLLTLVRTSWRVWRDIRWWIRAEIRQQLQVSHCTTKTEVVGLEYWYSTGEILARKPAAAPTEIPAENDWTAPATNTYG